MQGTEAIAQILKQEGTEYLFSYPNHPLIDAAAKIGIRKRRPHSSTETSTSEGSTVSTPGASETSSKP